MTVGCAGGDAPAASGRNRPPAAATGRKAQETAYRKPPHTGTSRTPQKTRTPQKPATASPDIRHAA
jgi:hypothetical protein